MSTVSTPIGDLTAALQEHSARVLSESDRLHAAEIDQPIDRHRWAQLLSIGVADAAVDSELGGLGLDEAALADLFTAAGEALLPSAVRETSAVLVPLLATADSAWAAATVDRLRAGSLVGGGGGQIDSGQISSGQDLALDGPIVLHSQPVWIGAGASVASLVTPDVAIAVELDGSTRTAWPVGGIDPGQGLALLSIEASDGDRCLVVRGEAATLLWRRWQLAILAELQGCAQAVLDRSAVYAGQRKQFGRPIGSFQAVAHLLADMYVGVTAGQSILARLTMLMQRGDPAVESTLAAAAHWLPAMARRVCEQAIQVHGGNGFSWEYGLHLFYRRSLAGQTALGGRHRSATRVGSGLLGTHSGNDGERR